MFDRLYVACLVWTPIKMVCPGLLNWVKEPNLNGTLLLRLEVRIGMIGITRTLAQEKAQFRDICWSSESTAAVTWFTYVPGRHFTLVIATFFTLQHWMSKVR